MRHVNQTIIYLLIVLLLSACQTLEKTLQTTEQALKVARSGSAQTIATIARSANKGEAAKQVLEARGEAYKSNPALLITDLRHIRQDFLRLMELLQGNVDATWGRIERRLPSRTRYVKYTHNYQSRAIVDFDSGAITVETLDQINPEQSLKNAIVTTLLTPDDPRAVDLFSDHEILLSSDRPPYLDGLVRNHQNQLINSPRRAADYAEFLYNHQRQTRSLEINGEARQASFVTFTMVNNFQHRQAEKYRPLVERYAKRYGMSRSLILAVIRTESNFNPFAVSRAPAYGLMQLVPTSGGRDAYRHAKGRDGVPSKQYLFNAENNIELGVAYLDVLHDNYLQHVQNKVSREYCVISAYNTGAGNVLRAFAPDRTQAIHKINSMRPAALYQHLLSGLPHEETRRYLHKVVDFRRQFATL